MEQLLEVRKPLIGNITNQQILYGLSKTIPAIDLLSLFSPEEFEVFIQEWTSGYLESIQKYKKVFRNSGAGDKGRDIVAWLDEKGDEWDCFQCKHYNDPLKPNEVWVEFGKLCYYTFKKDYTIPRKYLFATSKGLGPLLKSYIQNPAILKNQLIQNWDNKCKKHITEKEEVELTGVFKTYVENFDFSIIGFLDPLEIIEQHRMTPYYVPRFGGGFSKSREEAITPIEIQDKELQYITKLLEAYSEERGQHFSTLQDLSPHKKFINHLNRERIHYHKAHSLDLFERDTLPEGSTAFKKLKDSVFMGVIDTVESDFSSGFARVKEVTKTARGLQLSGNPLTSVIEDDDKHGICHHLANDNKISWVINDDL